MKKTVFLLTIVLSSVVFFESCQNKDLTSDLTNLQVVLDSQREIIASVKMTSSSPSDTSIKLAPREGCGGNCTCSCGFFCGCSITCSSNQSPKCTNAGGSCECTCNTCQRLVGTGSGETKPINHEIFITKGQEEFTKSFLSFSQTQKDEYIKTYALLAKELNESIKDNKFDLSFSNRSKMIEAAKLMPESTKKSFEIWLKNKHKEK